MNPLEYWKKRCELAESINGTCHCDPDTTPDRIESHGAYHTFILEESPAVSEDVKAQGSDAVEFTEWLRMNTWEPWTAKFDQWYKIVSGMAVRKTTAELYQLFQQPKQSKS